MAKVRTPKPDTQRNVAPNHHVPLGAVKQTQLLTYFLLHLLHSISHYTSLVFRDSRGSTDNDCIAHTLSIT